ncbi:hypothetical protein Desdi_1655 [Desulfitobacterium dichloroeliminans LMG P-21439]|uniref:Membrane-spanning protein n=1 Tax=Desulfitobacterium dichloroeliminans (strain LMG P-21439 / DCA1) TaxID=871963 RepID=L0F5P8_DESDL|nr:hypothetical protein [Desulfitobacterium dichloroeliminans]AGA69144.1 hypothetical protein Desdi_1655 [Desulfitobacterium dichloroeliminans LMG P-21439]
MNRKTSFIFRLYILLCISIIPLFIIHLMSSNWLSTGMCLLTIFFMSIPFLLERKYKLVIPQGFLTVLILFFYASMFLGTANHFYIWFWWWDKMLHGSSGFIFAHMGFLLMIYLCPNLKEDTQHSRILAALFAFSFSVAAGGVWEIYEYTMDSIFGTFYQGVEIDDTMLDIILDALGSLVFAFVLYFVPYSKFNRLLNILSVMKK